MAFWGRYTGAAVFSILITVSLIFGMKALLGKQPLRALTDDLTFRISYVQAEEEMRIRKRNKRKLPEVQKSSQPPTHARMQIKSNAVNDMSIPNDFAHTANQYALGQIDLPGFNYYVGKPSFDGHGGIKGATPPMYPLGPLMKDIEGWVKVLITVNPNGQASEVIVVDSYPPRIFDDATVNTVMKWKYYQKIVNDQAVSYQLSQTIEFKIPKPDLEQ